MRKTGFIAAAALWLGAAGFVAAQDEAALVQKYKLTDTAVLKAQKYLDQGKPEKCEAELRSCFAAVPDHHAALYIKSQSLYKAGDYAAALAVMDEAKAGYRRFDAAVKKMRAAKLEDDLATVQSLIDALPDLETRAAQTQCKVGVYNGDVMDMRGRINQKAEDLKQRLVMATEAAPAEYLYFTGNCLYKLNRSDEAEAFYRAAVEAAPDHANAYTNLINLLYLRQSLDEAKGFLALAEAHKVRIHPGLKKAVLEAK